VGTTVTGCRTKDCGPYTLIPHLPLAVGL